MDRQPLVLIFTGDGKGKTTAAFGQALRALGHGLRVCVIQFIKSSAAGEAKALAALPLAEIHVMGTGFTWERPREEVEEAARRAWLLAREKILAPDYGMVVLDEVTYPFNYGILDEEELLRLLGDAGRRAHVVLTGRNASPTLIAAADLVTEMRAVKHPYTAGAEARKGIEF